MKPQLIIIRGVPCSGKSTIADKLRAHFPIEKTAVIHTELFYHEIVKGDKPFIAMKNTRMILRNYLKNKYSVILEGTLSFKDKYGDLYINKFIKIAKRRKIPVKVLFFTASLVELKKREYKRQKISIKLLNKLYTIAMKSKVNNEIVIDTTNKSPFQVLSRVKKEISK